MQIKIKYELSEAKDLMCDMIMFAQYDTKAFMTFFDSWTLAVFCDAMCTQHKS